MAWYYNKGGQQFGPVETEELRGLVASGQLSPQDQVWADGYDSWKPIRQVEELSQPGPTQAPSSPYASAGAAVGAASYTRPPSVAFSPVYAGFWLRFLAWFLDHLIFAFFHVAAYLTGTIFFGADEEAWSVILALIELPLGWLYFALLESSESQATLGKQAMGLIVTDSKGARISFLDATGRYFAKILSALIFMIGFIMAGFTQRKQALHDILADCLVLRRR